jgi:hypothetical protein
MKNLSHRAIAALELLRDLPDGPSLFIKSCRVFFHSLSSGVGIANSVLQQRKGICATVASMATGRQYTGTELSSASPEGDRPCAYAKRVCDLARPK